MSVVQAQRRKDLLQSHHLLALENAKPEQAVKNPVSAPTSPVEALGARGRLVIDRTSASIPGKERATSATSGPPIELSEP